MKKLAILFTALYFSVNITGTAYAISSFFDFDDGVVQAVETPGLSGLGTYMTNIFGAPVNPNDSQWVGNAAIFNSDAIKTFDRNSRIDFEPGAPGNTNWKLNSVSFNWAVYQATKAKDFGLDVYDDLIEGWRKNIFFITGASDGDNGFSGLIAFDNSWEITKIKFHDAEQFDVGMDNLTINYDSLPGGDPIPEPISFILFGSGLLGLMGYRRKQ